MIHEISVTVAINSTKAVTNLPLDSSPDNAVWSSCRLELGLFSVPNISISNIDSSKILSNKYPTGFQPRSSSVGLLQLRASFLIRLLTSQFQHQLIRKFSVTNLPLDRSPDQADQTLVLFSFPNISISISIFRYIHCI